MVGGSDGRPIPIANAAEFLNQLQNLVNHIGDYLTGSDYRSRGHSPDFVRKRCSLVFKNVEVGSFKAQLELEDDQRVLEGYATVGEASIQTFYDLLAKVTGEGELEDSMNNMIQHPLHRSRIVEDIYKMWPDEHGVYRIKFRTPRAELLELNPGHKLTIEGLLSRFRTRKVSSVKGVLSMIEVAPKEKVIRVIGPDGRIKCIFPKEQEETAIRLLGKPVLVYGEANFDADGNVREIAEVSQIKPFSHLELLRIFSNAEELQLSQPLVVAVDYRDNMWVMENEELAVSSIAIEYEECLRDFNSAVLMVWKEYAKADNKELTKDAIELKRKILQYVENGQSFA